MTFVVGVFVGAYLYMYGFSEQFDVVGDLGGTTTGLEVYGEGYGGCVRGGVCGSFELQPDGRFTSFPPASDLAARKRSEGTVDPVTMRELEEYFTVEVLTELVRPIANSQCSSFVDGVDYRYRMILDGEEYLLDTCATELYEDDIARALLRDLEESVGL